MKPHAAKAGLWVPRLGPGIAVLSVCAAAVLPPSCARMHRRQTPLRSHAASMCPPRPRLCGQAIGPFCAIADWHPAIGSCVTDGKEPPTRTLVTKDGKTTFVEPEIGRSDSDHFYSYAFASSPFPVTHYEATIHVVANIKGGSTVVWHGTYTPLEGPREGSAAGLRFDLRSRPRRDPRRVRAVTAAPERHGAPPAVTLSPSSSFERDVS